MVQRVERRAALGCSGRGSAGSESGEMQCACGPPTAFSRRTDAFLSQEAFRAIPSSSCGVWNTRVQVVG